MSGNNNQATHTPGDNFNRQSCNDNSSSNNNNFNTNSPHPRNPYSQQPQQKMQQQQQQQQQYSNNTCNSNEKSFQVRNPYSQQQQQPRQNHNNNNHQNGGAVSSHSSSFSINPMQQQQHQRQTTVANTYNNPYNNNTKTQPLSSSSSVPKIPTPAATPVMHHHQQHNHQRQEQQQDNQRNDEHQKQSQYHNNNDKNIESSSSSSSQLQQLRNELDQSNESNFELEASVITLEVELEHTRRKLTEQASNEKSKLEHELRLAQRESQRWKVLAQQQQQNGRSIVSNAMNSTPATTTIHEKRNDGESFSSRIMGNASKLQSPTMMITSVSTNTNYNNCDDDSSSVKISKDKNLSNDSMIIDRISTSTSTSTNNDNDNNKNKNTALSDDHVNNEISNVHSSIGRLALNLLTQLEPSSSRSKSKIFTHNNDDDNSNSNSNNQCQDEDSVNEDDNAIRQVLLSISAATSCTSNFLSHSRGINSSRKKDGSDDYCATALYPTSCSSSSWWTEGRLVEWLVRNSSLELSTLSSADRYWSTLLLQSPEARWHIVKRVIGSSDVVDETNTTIAFATTATANTTFATQQNKLIRNHPRRGRQNRIRKLSNNNNNDNDSGYEQIYRSLRDPWWDPSNLNVNRNDDDDDDVPSTDCTIQSSTSVTTASSSSYLIFREWVQCLAASQHPRHLQTLRILVAEAAGRNGLTNSAYSSGKVVDEIIDNDGTGTSSSNTDDYAAVWWELCYPSIATTIQRIIYRKLIRSTNNYGSSENRLNPRMKEKKSTNNDNGGIPTSNATKNNDSISCRNRLRYRIGKVKDRLKRLPIVGVVVMPNTNEENTNTSMEIDPDYDPDTSYIERKYGYSKDEDEDGTINNRGYIEDGINITNREEEEESRVLALALAVWIGLLQVASSKQLDDWYDDQKGVGTDRSWRKKRYGDPSSSPPTGGLFMVNLLMDLLEELQFGQWMCDETINVSVNSMSSSRLLSSGLKSNNDTTMNDSMGGENGKNIDSFSSTDDDDDDNDGSFSSILSSSTIPRWYNIAIAVLAQIGRTESGMILLRTRSLDDRENDWMGNALDISIRQLHTLALHLDDVQTREGSIIRLGKCTCDATNRSNNSNHNYNYNDDPHTARLCRSVEAWVRLWHQVLLFVHHHQQKQQQLQQTEGMTIVSLRSLVLDLRDFYTSCCAILMTSEMIRPEIQNLIRWQLDELSMDEEDYEESMHYSR